jgi:ribonuclease Z
MFSRCLIFQHLNLNSIGLRRVKKIFNHMATANVSTSTKTKVVAQVVGIDTGDSSPSIIVATDTSRYLFDAGEGLQRFCGEHRTRLVKVDALFLSQVSAMRAGGLPGLMLTLADMGKKGVTVFGPTGLHDFSFALRHFLRREDFSLTANEFYSQREAAGPCAVKMPVITRSDLLVTPILLFTASKSRNDLDRAVNVQVKRFPQGLGRRPFEEALSSPINTPSSSNNNENRGPSSLVTLSSPFQPLTLQTIGCSTTKVLPLPINHLTPLEDDPSFENGFDSQTRDSAACYVCSTFPVAGRFHPDRAKALGVPVGPLFGDLMRGHTIELANTGVRVTPIEVKDPDAPGQLFAIICCPAVGFLPALLNSQEAFSQFFEVSDSGETKSKFLVVFHQTPASVAATPEYVEWMRRCGPLTKHVMLDHVPSTGKKTIDLPTMFFDQAVQQCKLNILRPGTFALPQPLPGVTEQLVSSMQIKGEIDKDLSDLQNIAKLKLIEASSLSRESTVELESDINRSSPIIHSLESHEANIYGLGVINAPPLLTYNVVPLASQGLQLSCAPNSFNGNFSKTSTMKKSITVKPSLPWLGAVRPDLAIQSMIDDPLMLRHLQKALLHKKASLKSDMPLSVPPDAEIIFTGTSSAVPNKYRNVTGIFVRMPQSAVVENSIAERSALFLDCGEGSYGSLVRRLGRERSIATALENGGLGCVDDAISCISLVWISHMHADHHLGTLRLIIERAKARIRLSLPELPVLIVGPTRMYFWLLEMSRIDKELAGQWRFADAEYFVCIPTIGSPMDSDSVDTEPITFNSETGKRARSPSREKSSMWQSPPGYVQCSVDEEKLSDGRSISEYSPTTIQQSDLREAPRSSRRPATHLVQMPLQHSDPSAADHLADHAFCEKTAAGLGLTSIRAVRVRHCHKAYGIRLEIVSKSSRRDLESLTTPVPTSSSPSPHSWSLVYSGDTRPCSELVALGIGGSRVTDLIQHHSAGHAPTLTRFDSFGPEQRGTLIAAAEVASSGCSLLIHEATFEDDEEGCLNAITKRHSTAGQACEVAHEMGAQHTLLTHFSARYPKLPVLKIAGSPQPSINNGGTDPVANSAAAAAEAAELAGRTLFVAYDLMRVTGRDLSELPALLPALHTLFAEDANAVEDDS